MDYSWDEAVSNLCHGANVYRFITIDTGVVGNTSSNASKCATVAGGGGNSHTKRSGVIARKFELNFLKRPIWVWLGVY